MRGGTYGPDLSAIIGFMVVLVALGFMICLALLGAIFGVYYVL